MIITDEDKDYNGGDDDDEDDGLLSLKPHTGHSWPQAFLVGDAERTLDTYFSQAASRPQRSACRLADARGTRKMCYGICYSRVSKQRLCSVV